MTLKHWFPRVHGWLAENCYAWLRRNSEILFWHSALSIQVRTGAILQKSRVGSLFLDRWLQWLVNSRQRQTEWESLAEYKRAAMFARGNCFQWASLIKKVSRRSFSGWIINFRVLISAAMTNFSLNAYRIEVISFFTFESSCVTRSLSNFEGQLGWIK